MNSKLHILLPVYNRRELTEKFINCLIAQTYTNYHLILIDDGSTDGTSKMVIDRIPDATILTGTGKWWWAGSLQQGINWLKRNNVGDNDIVVFINDDVIFKSDFLQIATDFLNEKDRMILPQTISQKNGQIEESGLYANLKKLTFTEAKSSIEINCLPTRGLFMRMGTLRKVGGFYPRLLPHYLSDYEFTIRANRLGFNLMTSPKLIIELNESTTGFRNFEDLSISDFFKRYFSIKSVVNPIYWTSFVFLTSPKLYIPINIIRVWSRAVREILTRLISGNTVFHN